MDLISQYRRLVVALLVVICHCRCGSVLSQELGVSSSGSSGSAGSFSGPGELSGGGGWSFQLGTGTGIGGAVLELATGTGWNKEASPAWFYGTFRVRGEARKLAYICVIHHPYVGELSDVFGNFQYRADTRDGSGELELSSGTGTSSFQLLYSRVPSKGRGEETKEVLTICDTPADLRQGRVFIVQMSDKMPVVTQVEDVPGESHDLKNIQKLLEDVQKAIDDGSGKRHLLALRPRKE